MGRRSGNRHVTPLLYHRDTDGSLLLIAANGAADWNPDWFHNVVADPHVEVELDGAQRPARATVLVGSDRETAWPTALEAFPGLEAAQRESARDIPLIRVAIDRMPPTGASATASLAARSELQPVLRPGASSADRRPGRKS